MDLDQILEEIGFGRFHYWMFFAGGTVTITKAWIQNMMGIISSSVILSIAGDEWSLSDTAKGIMGSIFMLGMVLGSYICGAVADKKGRMFPFKKIMSVALFSLFFLLVSMNAYMASVGLFFYGFVAGGEITMGGIVFQEFCPPSKQYMLVPLSLMWCLGGIIAALCVSFFSVIDPPLSVWRCVCLFNILVAVGIYLVRLRVSETPRFLIANNRQKEAQEVLQKISDTNNRDFLVPSEISLINENAVEEELLEPEKKQNSFRDIWKTKYFRTTVLFTLCFFSANFGFIFMNFFMPELLSNVGVEGVYVYLTMAAQQATGIPGILLAAYMVETRCGRKYSIVSAMICCGVVNLVFIFTREYWELVVFTSIATSTNYLAGAALLTISPESYETNIRNTGVGWANACGNFGGLVGPLIGGAILDLPGGFYMCIVITSAFSVLVGLLGFMLKETRGISLK